MARYNRIFKKSQKSEETLAPRAMDVMDWVQENSHIVGLAFGVVIIAILAAYGVSAYRQSSLEAAQAGLYDALKTAVKEDTSKDRYDAAVKNLKDFIAKGGPGAVMTQAHLELANLYYNKGDYKESLEEYKLSRSMAGGGSLMGDAAMNGEASVLLQTGKTGEAQSMFEELSKTSGNFPKASALWNLGLIQAMDGKKDVSLATLNKLKTDYPDFIDKDFLGDTIRRIGNGEFSSIAEASRPVPGMEPGVKAEAPKPAEAKPVAQTPKPDEAPKAAVEKK